MMVPLGATKKISKSESQVWVRLTQTEFIEPFAIVSGETPDTIIGELTPVALPSGMEYEFVFEKEVGPTEPTALVVPPNVIQLPEQIVPPVPASTVGKGLTVTDWVMAF